MCRLQNRCRDRWCDQGVGFFCFLSAATLLDVDKIANGQWRFAEVGYFATRAGVFKCFPVEETAITEEAVEFFIGVAHCLWGSGIGDVLRGHFPRGGTGLKFKEGVAAMRERHKLTARFVGRLESDTNGVCGRSGNRRQGRNDKVGDAARRSRGARHNTVFGIIDIDGEGRIAENTFVMSGEEACVGM